MFVGRRREQAELTRYLAAKRPRTTGLLVHGPVGIGKSRLVQHVLDGDTLAGLSVLKGRCDYVEEAPPYLPFQQALQQLGIDFEQVLPKGHEETGLSESIEDINLRRAHFITKLSDVILLRAQDEKVLVLIEDLQWADTGTFLVISRLLDSSTPNLRFIATYRTGDEAVPETHERLMRLDADVRQLPLAGLSRKELRQLVDQTLRVGVLSAEEITRRPQARTGCSLELGEYLLPKYLALSAVLQE